MITYPKTFYIILVVIVLIGALNWGLIGAFNFNAVEYINKGIDGPTFAKVIYVIVGLAALLLLFDRGLWDDNVIRD
jgi:uncharacterized protein